LNFGDLCTPDPQQKNIAPQTPQCPFDDECEIDANQILDEVQALRNALEDANNRCLCQPQFLGLKFLRSQDIEMEVREQITQEMMMHIQELQESSQRQLDEQQEIFMSVHVFFSLLTSTGPKLELLKRITWSSRKPVLLLLKKITSLKQLTKISARKLMDLNQN
jgi:hypothetical protein